MISAAQGAVVLCMFLAAGVSGGSSTTGEPKLQIHLPREVVVNEQVFRLGQTGVVDGDEQLSAKAGDVVLGQFSTVGQAITVNRSAILSRLASNGILAQDVMFTGANEVMVRRKELVISGEELVRAAKGMLEKNAGQGALRRFAPVRVPRELVVAGGYSDVKLVASLPLGVIKNPVCVDVQVFADGRCVASGEVRFSVSYKCRRVTAVDRIAAGAAVTAENTRVEEIFSRVPEAADWKGPYGLVAKREIKAGEVIIGRILSEAEPAIVVERNSTVVIRVERPGLMITATGKARENGRAGDFIKVLNVDSQRLIVAKVNEDGTVEPVF